jgi:hypothetical protein
MGQSETSEARWEVDLRIVVNRKHSDDERVYEDAVTVRYPADWTPQQIAVDQLQRMAAQIERGEMPEGKL